MAREAYEKTIWVDKVTPLNPANLNKLEEAVAQVDADAISLVTRVEAIESIGGVGDSAQDIIKLKSDVTSLQESLENKAESDHTHSEFTTYNEYGERIKTIEDLGLVVALKAITDRLSALEKSMSTHTHETLVGATAVGVTPEK